MSKKRTFRQHVPGCVEGVIPFTFEFETLEELLSHEWIKKRTKEKDFYRFSLSKKQCLMEERDDGYWWWVLGYIDDTEGLDIPEWEGAKEREDND